MTYTTGYVPDTSNHVCCTHSFLPAVFSLTYQNDIQNAWVEQQSGCLYQQACCSQQNISYSLQHNLSVLQVFSLGAAAPQFKYKLGLALMSQLLLMLFNSQWPRQPAAPLLCRLRRSNQYHYRILLSCLMRTTTMMQVSHHSIFYLSECALDSCIPRLSPATAAEHTCLHIYYCECGW